MSHPALKFLCDAVTETGSAIRVTKDFLALTMSQSTKRDRLLLLLLILHVVVVATVDQIWAPPIARVQVSESRFPLLLPGSWHNGCEISIIFCTLWMPFSAGGYISLVAIQIIIDNANARGELTKKCGTF